MEPFMSCGASCDQLTPMFMSQNNDLNDTVMFDQSRLSDDSEIVLRRQSAAPPRSGRSEGTTQLENDDAISISDSHQLDEEFQLSSPQNAELQALSNNLIRNYLKSVRRPAAVAPELSYQVPRANAKGKTKNSDVSVKEVKQVHRTARKDTTDLIIKGLTQHCISKGNNKRQQLRDMHTILQSTGLLTMLLEQRTVPVISETNLLGYTPPRVIMVAKQNIRHDDIDDDLLSIASAASNANTEAIALQEDDYCLFQHDQARLMLLVLLMFHASLPIDKTNRSF